MARYWFFWLMLAFLLSAAVCLPFLSSPVFFDDQDFFQVQSMLKVSEQPYWYPRVWVYKSLVATYDFFDASLVWLRVGNYILHLCVSIAFFLFSRELLTDLDSNLKLEVDPSSAAALAALVFSLHPLAIFVQGYLVQRSILCATLFALLALLFFWRGMSGSRIALAGSCLFTLLAIYAKEHAVMLPLGAILLLILRLRSGVSFCRPSYSVYVAILAQCCISILVVFQLKGLLGATYEPLFSEMLGEVIDIPTNQIYPLSVANQMDLFFKYLLVWAVPVPGWVAVDIRAAFPLDYSVRTIFYVISYFTYMLVAFAFVLRGGVKGLVGFSFLLPGCLFFSEFAAVRLQEPFVIYRSYLWFPFIMIALAIGLRRLRWRLLFLILILAVPLIAALSYERLKTLSHPVLLWQDAADVYDEGVLSAPDGYSVFGGYRIYYNLGSELRQLGFLSASLEAFNRCLELKPGHVWALANRGALYLDMKNYSAAKADYGQVLQTVTDRPVAWNGLAQALEGLGEHDEAKKAKQVACKISNQEDCGEFQVETLRLR